MAKVYKTSLEAKLDENMLNVEASLHFPDGVDLKIFAGVEELAEVKNGKILSKYGEVNNNKLVIENKELYLMVQVKDSNARIRYKTSIKEEREIRYITHALRVVYPGGELSLRNKTLQEL
ncbi:hypothetical protein DRN75_00160 [Nanoarchaeota archaeon]|nr:MAG: hypothetical protein DRN75_00160 [Nanoarchaeota archaeon]